MSYLMICITYYSPWKQLIHTLRKRAPKLTPQPLVSILKENWDGLFCRTDCMYYNAFYVPLTAVDLSSDVSFLKDGCLREGSLYFYE